jgi:hypothetical protein
MEQNEKTSNFVPEGLINRGIGAVPDRDALSTSVTTLLWAAIISAQIRFGKLCGL